MSRYIDADALGIGKADRNAFTVPEYADGWNSAIEIIANAPTADVAPVRHGHWIIRDVRGLEKEVSCSVCHSKDYYSPEWYKFIRYPAYCSDCGAKMDEERKEG